MTGLDEIEHLCEVMHDAYERAAVGAGWQTQEASRKPWSEVSEANKETMRDAVTALMVHVMPKARGHALQEAAEYMRNHTEDVDEWKRADIVAWLCAGADGAWECALPGEDEDDE